MSAVHEWMAKAVTDMTYWAAVGFVGQTLFFGRFLVQWIVSEKKRESVIPIGFWYLSIVGSVLVLIYAISRHDLVISMGQSTGLLVYIRNLMLIRRKRAEGEAPA